MKIRSLTMLIATFITGPAMADGMTGITCRFKERPYLKIEITAGEFSGGWSKTSAAKVLVGGPRFNNPVMVEIEKKPIQTRTVVGVGYKIDLPSGDTIRLEDIQFAPVGWKDAIGFTGVYLHGGQSTELACKYE